MWALFLDSLMRDFFHPLRRWTLATGALGVMLAPAAAQDALPAGGAAPELNAASADNRYPAAYFDQFQPTTARDMVERIPGFALQGDQQGGGRGFGQANLNILINGRRPSSKTSGAEEILGRIPAQKVIHIEIKDGASLDIPGLSGQVADIITGGSGLSGSWKYALRFEQGTEPQLLDGDISISGESGALSYVASLNSGQFIFTENGTETFADGGGFVFQNSREDIRRHGTRPSADLNLTYAPDNGHIANLNLSAHYANANFRIIEDFTAVDTRGQDGQSQFFAGEDELEYEIGADYAFPAGPGTLKLIGLHRFEDSDQGDIFQEFFIGSDPFTSIFDSRTLEGEFIARSEYSLSAGRNHDWQLSLEGAFNYLDRDTVFIDDDTPQTAENIRVEERRAEGNITHSWQLNQDLNIQSSIGAEFSQISVPSEGSAPREFIRPKGFLSASYTLSPRYSLRAKIEREVGQLDFGLFTDGINLSEDFENSGNSEIVPTQSWNAEVEIDRQDAAALSGTVRGFVNFIQDPIDRIRFIDGSEGPGNLDTALQYGIEANATWLLDSVGLNGMRIELEGSLSDSEIDDPVTGLKRRINNTEIWDWSADFRYDIPRSPYAIGGRLRHMRESPFLRLDQTFDGRGDRPRSFLFLDHKNLFGMNWRMSIQNILGQKIVQPRVIFDGDRNGDILEVQFFERERGPRFSLEVSDTF